MPKRQMPLLRVGLPMAAGPLMITLVIGAATPTSAMPAPADTGPRTPVSAASAAANSRISSVLPARTSSKVLGRRFTMTVWDSSDASFVFTKRPDASLRGASTTKILTSVAVLRAAGADHRMPTTVWSGAPGDIVLRAGGDPLLSSADLRALATDTARAVIADKYHEPNVRVLVDDTLFPGTGQSKGWPNAYLPGQVRPVNAFARDDNKVRDAAADAGKYFVAALRKVGVRAKYAGHQTTSQDATKIATFAGHTIGEAVSRTLLISDNDTAEMLFRQVAVSRGARPDWAGAREAVAKVLAELKIPLAGVNIVDGSGLSLQGRLTAGALTSALAAAISPDHPELAGLRRWLPVAGRTGTLKAAFLRFNSKPAKCAAGRIQAKTGTVADSIALAGYAEGSDGVTKVFVSIVNSRPSAFSRMTTRKAVDKVASSITGCW